ncbi:serine hydrolase domain-containing protein [Spirosoma radiotolerans]|uniref:serine hydrolase domain-containing protein n=1 Tax=Spirosoma radiotolerans TaxID=1379870 RepID=UPI000696181B|nr:serine hydrolase domain-containing protein [Spirosoma radiotolerans]
MVIIACRKPGVIVSRSLPELNIPARMQHYNVPGLSVAIISDFTIDTVLTYGVQDITTKIAVTGSTRFQAASISKAVSAVVALRETEKKLSLTEDINNYLTSWHIPQGSASEPITLAHLLSHTAGINVPGYAGFDTDLPMPTITAILNGAAGHGASEKVQKTGKVGKAFTYSGGGYCIVQQALEDRSGQSFAELSDQRLFQPLGLSNSSFRTSFSPSEIQRMASGHLKNGNRVTGKWRNYPAAAGGLWTTATDLAKLIIEIQKSYHNQSNKLLSQNMTRQMLTPFNNPIYGLGFYLDGKTDNLYFSHNGNNIGFQANFIAHTQKGYGVVVMTNSDAGNSLIKEIFTAVSNQYGWQGFPCK